MTQIDFYTNVVDKLSTAARIVAKAYALGRNTVIFCPDEDTSHRIDRLLWTVPPTAFIPHCLPCDALARSTPVLVDCRGDDPLHDELLINLRAEWPPYFGRFERLIEVVTQDVHDRQSARDRYRFYRDRGYEIRTHDLSQAATSA